MPYYPGSLVTITATFTDITTSSPADPTTVTLIIDTPGQVSTTYTYGSSAIVKDATGVYHYDLTLTEPSTPAYDWQYEWKGTGAVVAVVAGSIAVLPFPAPAKSLIQTQIDTLTAAIATGSRRVRFQDREVEYQSIADMIKARAMLYATQGTTTRQIRVWTNKGL